ncbi:MAG: ABC transporter permease [Candidatus Rokubacteria bacterium]|nr:ABC transporter permease [Candidatus Rokubacteria bacterium]
MVLFLLRRLLLVVPVLLGVSVVVFAVLHISPGDPAEIMLGPQATQQDITRLRTELGLDQPLPVQYARWMGHVVQGDLGRSLWMKRPVLGEVLRRFQATLILTTSALLLAVAGGITLGVVSAARRNSLIDRFSSVASIFGASMPSFWLGIVLMVVFALSLGWLPASGMYAPYGDNGLGDLFRHLILPTITLAAFSLTIIARLTRSTMLEILGQDFVRTARAKGVRETVVIVRHALMNALIPTVSAVGVQAGFLLGGAVFTETVFAWPGVGTLMVQGILARDFPLVQGCVLVIAVCVVVVNLAVDVLYAMLDPQIRHE